MYKNLSEKAIEDLIDNPLELAKFNTMRAMNFVDPESDAREVLELVDDSGPNVEEKLTAAKIVFDGDEGNVDLTEFKQFYTIEDDSEPIDEDVKAKCRAKLRERILFWTEDNPEFVGHKSKPDNTIEYFLDNEFNKNGTRKLHHRDRIMCEICGCCIRRSQTTAHLRTKKHRNAAADLDYRLHNRLVQKQAKVGTNIEKLIEDKVEQVLKKMQLNFD